MFGFCGFGVVVGRDFMYNKFTVGLLKHIIYMKCFTKYEENINEYI